MTIMMFDSIKSIQKTGGFLARSTGQPNRKYSNEFKINALELQKSLGSRNKAAKQLGIAPSLLTTFKKQQSEGEF